LPTVSADSAMCRPVPEIGPFRRRTAGALARRLCGRQGPRLCGLRSAGGYGSASCT
jgi:hypothetical protein